MAFIWSKTTILKREIYGMIIYLPYRTGKQDFTGERQSSSLDSSEGQLSDFIVLKRMDLHLRHRRSVIYKTRNQLTTLKKPHVGPGYHIYNSSRCDNTLRYLLLRAQPAALDIASVTDSPEVKSIKDSCNSENWQSLIFFTLAFVLMVWNYTRPSTEMSTGGARLPFCAHPRP